MINLTSVTPFPSSDDCLAGFKETQQCDTIGNKHFVCVHFHFVSYNKLFWILQISIQYFNREQVPSCK